MGEVPGQVARRVRGRRRQTRLWHQRRLDGIQSALRMALCFRRPLTKTGSDSGEARCIAFTNLESLRFLVAKLRKHLQVQRS